jgi:predicted xylose isomerase-like sugar epimerase
LEDQIAQYEKVDWNTLTAQDATRAQQLFIAFQQAKDAKAKTIGELNTLQTQQSEASRQAMSAKLEEGRKTLERDIKGWNAELGQKLSAFGQKAYGFSPEQVASVNDPRAVKLLHDAYQWHNAQEQAKKMPEKKATVPTQTLKPTAADTRTPEHQSYMDDRKALKSAKTNKDRTSAAEKLILRKL